MDHQVRAFDSSEDYGERRGRLTIADVAANDSPPFMLSGSNESLAHLDEIRTERPDQGGGRALDLIVACGLLLAFLPLMAFCAIAIRFSSPGPLLFRQPRIGRGGRDFTCLKFRTMVVDADAKMAQFLEANSDAKTEWETVQKLQRDPRVTWIGQFLRRYCLDELPQLFNVIAGQMSVVGPRPIVASEVERYGSKFKDYCSVKPGLTGLWQISGKHELSYDERVRLDSSYARSKSVRSDIVILWRTVPIVIFGLNC